MEIAKKQLQKEGAKMPASTYFKPMTPSTSWVQLLAVKPHVRRNANLNKFSISLKGIYTKMNEVIITSIWEAWVQNSVKA